MDTMYGPIYDEYTSTWYLGKTPIIFSKEKNEIIIQNVTFPGSQCLYELIFNKTPVLYKRDDYDNYGKILDITKVHHMNSDGTKLLEGSSGFKYKHVILPLVQEKFPQSGSGVMMTYAKHQFDIFIGMKQMN
ncbi:hypothetical protein HHI36_004839 [Cryptolaemus montrouzieri]|uniref:DUF8207 domain-containing protein n=1 Tax=Cryptolaemus montrouzieri TaxID=559131 RepID=A0ABD2NSS9_9CUCU